MYNYDLIISIFSEDVTLEQTVSKIASTPKFTYNVKKYNAVDTDVLLNSDVVIWDLPISLDKNNLKENAKVILCTSKFKDEFNIYDEIIIKPFNYDYVKYSVEKVLEKIALEEELYFKNTCLNTAIDGIPDMFWIKTLDGIHTLLNKEFCEVVGKTKEDVTGKDHYYIWNVSLDDPNSGADVCKRTEDEVIAAGRTLRFTEWVKNANGMRQLVTYKSPLYDRNGKVIGTIGFGHDVTDLKNISVENEILLNSVPYAVLLRDGEGKIQNVNNYFETYFDISKESIVGKIYSDWATKTFGEERNINEDGYVEGTYNINGEQKTVELRYEDMHDIFNNVTGQVCIFRDVTLQRKLEAQIIEDSNVDFMTKLYNRRYLDQFISNQEKNTTLNLFAIDLDHFKSINDTYGHKAGDEAIILTANIIKKCFPDDLVVRMGGDEFLVVKVGMFEIDKLKNEAQNLLDTLNKYFKNSTMFKILSASIGISQGLLGEDGVDLLLQKSDAALYSAKEQGRACYIVNQ